jgi:hypothetical protein
MSFVVIDIQGFKTPEFTPKELAIWDGNRLAHYVFKEPFSFKYLPEKFQREANWLSNNYHRIKWSDGDVDLSRIPYILNNIKRYTDTIYCKGQIKSIYLKKLFGEEITVKDLNQTPSLRNLPREHIKNANSKCFYHQNGVCAIDNVKLIYDYIVNPFSLN